MLDLRTILQVKGLTGADADLALLRLSIQTFDPWVIGVIGAAGILTALVPGSMILMAASTILAKNVYKVIKPDLSDAQVTRTARYLVPVVALIAVFFTFKGGNTLVALLLMGYSLVTQLFPTLVFSLMKNNFVTKAGAFAGIGTGVATVTYITITGKTVGSIFPFLPQAIQDFNVGIIAMIVNLMVLFVVSAVTKSTAVVNTKTEKAL